MAEKKIKLKYPIKLVDGKELSELTVQVERLKTRDQMEAQQGDASQAEVEIRLLAKVFKLNPEDLMEIDLRDYSKLQEVLRGFLS